MHDDLGGPLAETITLQKAKKLTQCMAHETPMKVIQELVAHFDRRGRLSRAQIRRLL